MIEYHAELEQGTEEWLQARCGLLTASEMKLILTATLKKADNEKTRQHLYELLGQRITKYVEPRYIGDDMLRGQVDEVYAKIAYAEKIAPVQDMGFITNDEWGFKIGFSPDGLIGDDGFIECKSRMGKHQIYTIVECMLNNIPPEEYVLQIQTGFLVTKRKWCDFISYCGGLPMAIIRVYPDHLIMSAILDAARSFEEKLATKWAVYNSLLKTHGARLIPTERIIIEEMRL